MSSDRVADSVSARAWGVVGLMGRKLLNGILWCLAAAVMALLFAMIIIPRLMGWVPLTVLTGSMEPNIPVGSQVYVKPVDSAENISVGDVISFMPNPDDETLVTHRVVGISSNSSGEKTFTVKGDANNSPDPEPVRPKQIRGVVMYHLPYVGYLSVEVDGKKKIIIALIAGMSLICYAVWQIILIIRDRVAGPRDVSSGDAASEGAAASSGEGSLNDSQLTEDGKD